MGEPPGGVLDYLIVFIAVVAVVIATVLAIWWLVRPGEGAPDHIKRTILD